MTKKSILLLGAGGHARACIDVIEQSGKYSLVGLIGSDGESNQRILGYPVIGVDADLEILHRSYRSALVGVGQIKSSLKREELYALLLKYDFNRPSIVSPFAYVSTHATLGEGSIVMHGAHVNAGAHIGDNCIINSNALIEHDVIVCDHCHISTATVLNGGVVVGKGSFVGSNATIREDIRLGERSVIPMGESVTADVQVRNNHHHKLTR